MQNGSNISSYHHTSGMPLLFVPVYILNFQAQLYTSYVNIELLVLVQGIMVILFALVFEMSLVTQGADSHILFHAMI